MKTANEPLNPQALLRSATKYWYVFLIGLGVALAANKFFLRRTHPIYQARTKLLINDNENASQFSEEFLFTELGLGLSTNSLENEMMVLTSTPLLMKVVDNLGLQFQYARMGRFLERDLYQDSPVAVAQWLPRDSSEFYAIVYPNERGGFVLETEWLEEDRSFDGEFGKPLDLPSGEITLIHRQYDSDNSPISIRINTTWAKAKEIQADLEAALVGEKSSIVELSLKNRSRQRAMDILGDLIRNYNQLSVQKRNQDFVNTIDLINTRISMINEELTDVEISVENYKQRFNMVELSSEGSRLMEELSALNRSMAETKIQLTILDSIENFLVKNQDDFEFVPTNATLTNLTLSNQLSRFNELLAEQQKMKNNLGPEHPDLKLVNQQLQNFRQTIIENIRNIKNDLTVTRNSTLVQNDDLTSRIQSLPRYERGLVEIERKKTIKENLYLFLLQKREEAAMSMAVNVVRCEVVEPPFSMPTPIRPNKPKAWLVALFLGLGIPTGIVFLLSYLANKVETEKDLQNLSPLNLAGVIAKAPKKSGPFVVRENSNTPLSEMFRMLRANLFFFLPGEGTKTLLITSCSEGEGKSFIAKNLAVTLALSGQRVVLIQTDLRCPDKELSLPKPFSASNKGVVDYIIDPSLRVDDVIQESGLHENFHIISHGPKPPNPGELIMSDRLREMVALLQPRYNYILFDTPPVSIVADALQLSDLADATLFVVRARHTRLSQIEILNKIAKEKKAPSPSLVLNDVSMRDYVFGKYGFGYNFNAASSYFEKA